MIIRDSYDNTFWYTETDQSIFEECNYDRYIFEEKYPEVKEYTAEEIKYRDALWDHVNNYSKYPYEVTWCMGGIVGLIAIFKIEDGRWVVWCSDERRGFYAASLFDNVYDSCIEVIKRKFDEPEWETAISYFDNAIKSIKKDDKTPRTRTEVIAKIGHTGLTVKEKLFQAIEENEHEPKIDTGFRIDGLHADLEHMVIKDLADERLARKDPIKLSRIPKR